MRKRVLIATLLLGVVAATSSDRSAAQPPEGISWPQGNCPKLDSATIAKIEAKASQLLPVRSTPIAKRTRYYVLGSTIWSKRALVDGLLVGPSVVAWTDGPKGSEQLLARNHKIHLVCGTTYANRRGCEVLHVQFDISAGRIVHADCDGVGEVYE